MDQNSSSSNLNSKNSSAKKKVNALPSLSKTLGDNSGSAASMNVIATPRDNATGGREGLLSAREGRDGVKDAPPAALFTGPSVSQGGNNIKVICRIRPINQKELDLGNSVCVEIPDPQNITVRIAAPQGENDKGVHKFAFDRVFDMQSTQEEVFYYGARPAIESVLEGFNGTVFAYGQTSAGKTHTMQGKIDDPNLRGIIPRMVTAVFQHIEESPEHIEFTVKVSIVEIYSEKIRDLISPEKNNLKVREDKGRGIYIEDVTEASVASENEVYTLMRIGNTNRAVCATNMNEGSSRSHLVFILSIHQKNTQELSAKTGKLYLIDLAGSEKVGKTGAAGQTLQEAKDINKSLSALGNVINALTDGKGGHIPYRDSKLTRILQESLGGNSKTTLIIACSPSSFNDQETLSTLRFGYRAKSIKNKAKVNKEMTVAELQVLLEKAEKNIAEKDKKIQELVDMLSRGEVLSPGTQAQMTDSKERSNTDKTPVRKASVGSADLSEKEDDTPKKGLSSLLTPIKQLESELQAERHNVRIQTERVNELKTHHSSLTMKVIITERENEKLIYKLASMTLKINSLEETIEENESQIQTLDELRTKSIAEIDELRKAKKLLTKQLAEKDQEISRIHRLTSFFNIEKKDETQAAEDAGAVSSAAAEKARKELTFKINEISKKWISDVIEKAKIAEADKFQELASAYRQKLKKVILGSNFAGASASESGIQELKKKIAQMEEELVQEKKKNEDMISEHEKMTAEYQKMLAEGIPNLDELTNKAITRVLEEEKAKFEREKRIMAKELEKRVEKITKAEIELEKEKDKSNKLEQTMMETEKSYEFKLENLEASLSQVITMVKNLDPQPTGRRVTVSERKPKDKSERLYNIEKQILETQELVNGLKKGYDTTKDFGSEAGLAGNVSTDRYSSWSISKNEPFNQYRDLIKKEIQTDMEKDEEFDDMNSIRKSMTFTDPRIVKKIRGGNRKTVGTTQDFLALLKSPGTDLSDNNKSNSSMTQSQVATPLKKSAEKNLEIP